MTLARFLHPIRSVRFRYYRLLGWLRLALSKVRLGGGVSAIGMPTVSIMPGSECSIGSGSTLVSVSFATALGVNHPVVLRTLRAEARIEIGCRVGISGGSICAAELVRIGDNTMLGANVTIADTDFHSLDAVHRAARDESDVGVAPVIVGRNVFIGTNCVVLKGVTIGDNSVIGAGSVVTKSMPADSVAAGNPCRVVNTPARGELRSP
jgi:acetyltransferase-like isoleucine patch superfamily enzyme